MLRCLPVLIVLCFTSLVAAQYRSDSWFPIVKDGKAGYIDRAGNIVIEPQFDGASYFSEGLARVSFGRDTIITKGFSQGFIDETGKVVIQPQWDVVSHFSEGLAAVGYDQTKQKVEINGRFLGYTSASHTWYRWGFINKRGEMVIEPKFTDVSEFRDGVAAAGMTVMSEWKMGFINTKGEWIIPPKFDDTNQFSDGLARIFIDDRYGYIDGNGKIVIEPQYSSAADFSEGLACVQIGGDVLRPKGMSVVRNHGKYVFIDRSGKVVIRLKNARCRSFSEGLASFEEFGKYGVGFIDHSGKIVIKPFGDGQSEFSDGLKFVILDGGKLGYITKAGALAIQLPFGKADDFYRGLAEVCESYDVGAPCGYIDKQGKVIWPLTK